MLKDLYFYPLIALLAGGLVVFALSIGEDVNLLTEDILEKGYILEGEDLVRLTMQPGTESVFVAANGEEPALARLTSTAARASLPPGPGVFAPLGPEYEAAFATRRLRLTITARASRHAPLPAFDMGYFTAGSGDSGWKRRQLSAEWEEYALEFTPGPLRERRGLDHFSIWPGETAELLHMDVLRMRIEVLG